MDNESIGGTIASGGLKSKLLLAAAAIVGLVIVLKVFVEKKAGAVTPGAAGVTPAAATAGMLPTRASDVTYVITAPGGIPTANDGTPGHTSGDPSNLLNKDANPLDRHIAVDPTPLQRLLSSLHNGAYYTPHGETVAQIATEFHIADPAALEYNSHNQQHHWTPDSVPTSDVWITRSAIVN